MRRATDDDRKQVLAVCAEALGWSGDSTDADFFTWKHDESPFGRSPIWVAESDGDADERPGGIVGVRVLMRWQLVGPAGQTKDLARAVDTATLPSHQGRGIFSRLTTAAVEALIDEGVAAIFNTPNDKSRPGYLKMGWESLGRLPVVVRPRRPATLAAMVRSRVAADKWGLPTDVGLDPATAFGDDDAVEAALAAFDPSSTSAGATSTSTWSTPLSVDYLRWRASFGPLACRVLPLGATVADGFILFRLRRRGELTQLSVLHVVAARSGDIRRAVGRLLADTGADVALGSDRRLGPRAGMLPLPGAGPILTWRPLVERDSVARSDLDFPLGTVELF